MTVANSHTVRLTPRVRRVLDRLAGREVPLTAHQLYAELRADGDRIGRTTIYRALHVLTEAGVVHEFRGGPGDEARYRACSPTPHDHLVCAACGRVTEVHISGLTNTLADLRRDGYLVASYHVELRGLCPRCSRPTTSSHS